MAHAVMEYSLPGPVLRPKQREEGTWCAEASWPNAPAEEVGYFETASDAHDWIIHKATDYFRQRAGL